MSHEDGMFRMQSKIPQPEQEHELLEVIKVAEDMEKRFKKIGLEIEVRKAKEMRKQAKIELKEIDLIKNIERNRDMNQLSNLTPSGNRSWLRSVHEQRKIVLFN